MDLEVRTRQLPLTPPIDAHARRRFIAALRRYEPRIRRVDIRIADLNGPRGGIDKRCRATVHLVAGGTLVAEAQSDRVWRAIDQAAERTARRVTRIMDRRAMHDH